MPPSGTFTGTRYTGHALPFSPFPPTRTSPVPPSPLTELPPIRLRSRVENESRTPAEDQVRSISSRQQGGGEGGHLTTSEEILRTASERDTGRPAIF